MRSPTQQAWLENARLLQSMRRAAVALTPGDLLASTPCQGTNRTGEPCRLRTYQESGLCVAHQPGAHRTPQGPLKRSTPWPRESSTRANIDATPVTAADAAQLEAQSKARRDRMASRPGMDLIEAAMREAEAPGDAR